MFFLSGYQGAAGSSLASLTRWASQHQLPKGRRELTALGENYQVFQSMAAKKCTSQASEPFIIRLYAKFQNAPKIAQKTSHLKSIHKYCKGKISAKCCVRNASKTSGVKKVQSTGFYSWLLLVPKPLQKWGSNRSMSLKPPFKYSNFQDGDYLSCTQLPLHKGKTAATTTNTALPSGWLVGV